jgi:NAD(P)H-hydrate epimerase
VRAAATVTLALPKLGLALYPGREAAGTLEVGEIGLPRGMLTDPRLLAEWIDAGLVRRLLPPRAPTAHKGDSGRVLLVAGSEGMAGAAALSATAAVRGGAGLVTLGVPRSLLGVLMAKVTEVMTFPLAETGTGGADRDALPALQERARAADVLAVGPGLGQHPRTGELLRGLIAGWERGLILDADALNLLAPASPGSLPAQAVLTPHPGELARLLGTTVPEIESDRVAAVRRAVAVCGCVVLLKGAATLVAAPDGRLAVNPTGTPAMATGGVGDVLTGLIGALLAQQLLPFEAAAAGAYLHGLAGELAAAAVGGPGMAASDLLAHLPAARALVTGACSPAGLPPLGTLIHA